MARRCMLIGKQRQVGNNVSHANNKNKRLFGANIHKKRLWLAEENRWVKLKLSTKALRIIDRVGLSRELLHKLRLKEETSS